MSCPLNKLIRYLRLFSLPLSLLLLLLSPPVLAQPIQVVASMQPLALMLRSVAVEGVEVQVLLDAGQSPHDFSLKMSDRRKLAAADLVVWVGPEMEPYLAKLVTGGNALALESMQESGSGPSGHKAAHQHHDHGDDKHLWLDPHRGAAMLVALGDALAQLLPERAAELRTRAAATSQAVKALLERPPSGAATRRYAVAHDAYSQFVEAFGFPAPVVIADSPELAPGVRTLMQAGARLQHGDCLLVDLNHRRKWVQKFASDHQLKLIEVDIMGVDQQVTNYVDLLSGLLTVFEHCR